MDDGFKLVHEAAKFARHAHRNQFRKYSGLPYIVHPARVAGRMMQHETATPTNVAVAWLHDVVEDCPEFTLNDVISRFGEEVGVGVKWLTQISKPEDGNRSARMAIDRRHWGAAPDEWRLVKLIDRIDNLTDMGGNVEGFLYKYAKESVLLLDESLRGVDTYLEEELATIINKILTN